MSQCKQRYTSSVSRANIFWTVPDYYAGGGGGGFIGGSPYGGTGSPGGLGRVRRPKL